jgi:hypothetical protein
MPDSQRWVRHRVKVVMLGLTRSLFRIVLAFSAWGSRLIWFLNAAVSVDPLIEGPVLIRNP